MDNLIYPPKAKVPADFPDFAVFASYDLTDYVIRPAKIMPAERVKKYGVIPTEQTGEPTFNCCVGNYYADIHTVYVNDDQRSQTALACNMFLPAGITAYEISPKDVGKIKRGIAQDQLVGFFHSECNARKSLKRMIADKTACLESEIEKLRLVENTL